MKAFIAFALCLLVSPCHAEEALWRLLRDGGHVLVIRHATTTPGVGDPEGFLLEDCGTQRNLSAVGRGEATRLGEALRKRRVPIGEVLSSPWCRCIETAELAFGRRPATWPALGNLFGRTEAAPAQVRELRRRIGEHKGRQNLVLVTHGSTTFALANVSPAQGEIVVLTPQGRDAFRVTGRLAPAATP